MAKQIINIGTIPNDNTGDPLRTAFDKSNDNFTELYEPEYVTFLGGIFRMGVRAGELKIDQTITVLGFAGLENTDWEELTSFVRP
jgi:hypothetical protein